MRFQCEKYGTRRSLTQRHTIFVRVVIAVTVLGYHESRGVLFDAGFVCLTFTEVGYEMVDYLAHILSLSA
ncbi:hypothetical protein WK90_23000 [Burkholderia cepacia]|nr:hypothetical protein WK83_26235 [Burkholderia cepacia]KVV62609.1 hypothetical protein WK85_05355 [Burkholderia cepacia]KVV67997.1 hypothetical protein WK84_20915 [Burkholderia cepacia]KVV75523.1 hypothetical protein WK86_29180 [Burkholderia cepacia]KVV79185.1 hypothetical protein WK87_29115 [Burkholderia cepacia]